MPCGGKARGERKREQKEHGRKLKTFLGLVSNLLLLSSHQRENSLRWANSKGLFAEADYSTKRIRSKAAVRVQAQFQGDEEAGAGVWMVGASVYLLLYPSLHRCVAFYFFVVAEHISGVTAEDAKNIHYSSH